MAISAQISEVAAQYLKDLHRDIERYGRLGALFLYTILLQLRPILATIQKRVVDPNGHEPDEASKAARAIRDSYTSVFTTVGVAGAIIAQIAVSELISLNAISEVTFVVQLAFILGVLAGILSVYFACIVQTTLSGLPAGAEVKEWLTTPERSLEILRRSCISDGHEVGNADELRMPSFDSALMLNMPVLLLNISLGSLLVGNGIYIGQLYTLPGLNSITKGQSLATLLTFVIVTGMLLVIGTVPALRRTLEGTNAARQDRQDRLRSLASDVHGRGSDRPASNKAGLLNPGKA